MPTMRTLRNPLITPLIKVATCQPFLFVDGLPVLLPHGQRWRVADDRAQELDGAAHASLLEAHDGLIQAWWAWVLEEPKCGISQKTEKSVNEQLVFQELVSEINFSK